MILIRPCYDPTLPDYPRMDELNSRILVNWEHAPAQPPVPFYVNSRRYPAFSDQNPLDIFKPMYNAHVYPKPRWVQLDPTPGGRNHAVLVFTDGSAPNNGYANVRAGCGIALRPDYRYGVSFPLERVPGKPVTSNRAELRAAHAALSLHNWHAEGFGKIVVACDSKYVVRGAAEYVASWEQNGWRNTYNREVANKDLWVMLIQAIRNLEAAGTIVQFYHINRNFNGWADSLAKQGAVSAGQRLKFVDN